MNSDKNSRKEKVNNEINEKLKGGQHADQEIVAELSAAVIGYLRGYELNGKSKQYIENYAKANWKTVFKVLSRVNRVVNYIVEKSAIELKTTEIESVEKNREENFATAIKGTEGYNKLVESYKKEHGILIPI